MDYSLGENVFLLFKTARKTAEFCEVARIQLAVDMFKAIVRDWYSHDGSAD